MRDFGYNDDDDDDDDDDGVGGEGGMAVVRGRGWE